MSDRASCEEVRALAPELALGIAVGDERARVLEHPRVPGVPAHLEELSGIADDLADPGAAGRFESRVLDEQGAERPERRRRRPLIAVAAAAVAALVTASAMWLAFDATTAISRTGIGRRSRWRTASTSRRRAAVGGGRPSCRDGVRLRGRPVVGARDGVRVRSSGARAVRAGGDHREGQANGPASDVDLLQGAAEAARSRSTSTTSPRCACSAPAAGMSSTLASDRDHVPVLDGVLAPFGAKQRSLASPCAPPRRAGPTGPPPRGRTPTGCRSAPCRPRPMPSRRAAGCARAFGPLVRREERDQPEQLVRGADQALEPRGRQAQLVASVGLDGPSPRARTRSGLRSRLRRRRSSSPRETASGTSTPSSTLAT